jgi:hypothetical protein
MGGERGDALIGTFVYLLTLLLVPMAAMGIIGDGVQDGLGELVLIGAAIGVAAGGTRWTRRNVFRRLRHLDRIPHIEARIENVEEQLGIDPAPKPTEP